MTHYIPPTIRQEGLKVHIEKAIARGKIHFNHSEFAAVVEDVIRPDSYVSIKTLQAVIRSKYGDRLSRQTLAEWVKVWKEERSILKP